MITLIGTGHVFNLTQPLLKILDEKKPETICIELDEQRYHALIMKQNNPEDYKKNKKNIPATYKLLAKFQDNMAEEYGVTAGQEMLTAINYAQSHQIPIKFIDLNAQEMFIKMLKTMTFREKLKLFFSSIGGIFVSKKRVEKELKKLENDFDIYIEEIQKKFPTIKKVLIDDRNQYMTDRIIEANQESQKVLVVIGDGHIPGITKILKQKNIEYEEIRLSDLRKQINESSSSLEASFSLEYRPMDIDEK